MYWFSGRNLAAALVSLTVLLAVGAFQLGLGDIFGWRLWVIAGGLIVLGFGWWIADALIHNRYSRDHQRFDAEHHWQYTSSSYYFSRRLHRHPFGGSGRATDLDLVSGPYNGYECAAFFHEVEHEGGDMQASRTVIYTVTAVSLPIPLPTIAIVPEDWTVQARKAVGGADIDFESRAFNKRWRVLCHNAKYAHDIVNPRLMERLLEPDAEGLALRIEGDTLFCWQAGRRGIGDLAGRLNVLTGTARAIPAFVIKEFRDLYGELAGEAKPGPSGAPAWATTPHALTSGRYTGLDTGTTPPGPEIDTGARLDRWGASGGKGVPANMPWVDFGGGS